MSWTYDQTCSCSRCTAERESRASRPSWSYREGCSCPRCSGTRETVRKETAGEWSARDVIRVASLVATVAGVHPLGGVDAILG